MWSNLSLGSLLPKLVFRGKGGLGAQRWVLLPEGRSPRSEWPFYTLVPVSHNTMVIALCCFATLLLSTHCCACCPVPHVFGHADYTQASCPFLPVFCQCYCIAQSWWMGMVWNAGGLVNPRDMASMLLAYLWLHRSFCLEGKTSPIRGCFLLS